MWTSARAAGRRDSIVKWGMMGVNENRHGSRSRDGDRSGVERIESVLARVNVGGSADHPATFGQEVFCIIKILIKVFTRK